MKNEIDWWRHQRNQLTLSKNAFWCMDWMLAHNPSGYVIFRLFLSRTITSSSFNFVPYMEVVSSPFLRRLQVKRVLRTKGWNSKYFTEYVTSSKEPWKRKFVKKWKQLSGNNLLVYLSLFLLLLLLLLLIFFVTYAFLICLL